MAVSTKRRWALARACAAIAVCWIAPWPVTAQPVPQSLTREYCVGCHNARTATGGLSLELPAGAPVSAHAETWEKVVHRLRLRSMPPVGVRRPDDATYDAAVRSLEAALDRDVPPPNGPPALRRLNRAEYARAVRDLLGMDVDVSALLPADDSAHGFDNVTDAQSSSPARIQAYVSAARRISALATGDIGAGAGSDTYTARQDLSQDTHIEGLPLGTVGGMVVRHTFPSDGEYELRVKLYRTNLNAVRGLEDPHQIEVAIDGRRVLLARVGGPEDLVAVQKNPTQASDDIEAGRLRIRLHVPAGRHTVTAAFLAETPPVFDATRLQRFVRDFNPYDAEGAPHVQSVTVTGPFSPPAESPRWPSPVLMTCRTVAAPAQRECARRQLGALGRRAFRRPLSLAEHDSLMTFYDQGLRDGGLRAGLALAVSRLLASPYFVYRSEPAPAVGVAPARATGEEFASRLSFFLWSTIPDQALLDLAAAGRLLAPEVIDAQVRRMLGDSRADAFVENFAGQWLQLRNLAGKVPDPDTFPDFDDNLRQAMRREVELFVGSILREDRSALDLLTGNETFVNERLARHYRMPGVLGSHFRRVSVADPVRQGLLGKGAILLVTSHATTTSPVLRGKWVLENLLGAPPPPPPPDVPALQGEGDDGRRPPTMRAQMERHRANPACAGCHKLMDPIGFALENFDAVGAWRTADDSGFVLDPAGELFDGSRVDGVAALRQALTRRPELFVQALTEKLFVYALGRGLTPGDMPLVRAVVRDARPQYRFSALVAGIARSAAFQSRAR